MSDNPTPDAPAPAAPEAILGGATPSPPAAPAPAEPPADPAATPPQRKTDWTPEEATAEIERLRAENKSWRHKYREAEPIVQAHNEAQEAAKTEVQRANDQLTAAQAQIAQLNVQLIAARHGIPEEDYDLLGSGTPEELESRAVRLAARRPASAPTPPPSDRPVEGLRPGASPTPPAQPDHSYPAAWSPQGRS